MTASAHLSPDVVRPGRPQAPTLARACVGASRAAHELKSMQDAATRLSR